MLKFHTSLPKINYRKAVIVGMLGIAIILRTGNLENIRPFEGDELSWVMIGTSLLTEGAPTSWTIFPHEYDTYEKMCYSVATPFLGHPPLFGILIGSWAIVTGQLDWCTPNWTLLRIPMIAISITTILMTYLLIRKLGHKQLAFFTLLAFTFFPSHVVSSRFIAAEHVLALLMIMALYAYAAYETTPSKKKRQMSTTILLVLCYIAPLIKLSGALIPIATTYLLIAKKKYRLATLAIAAAGSSLATFLLYGWYYNWAVFRDITTAHHTRPQTFAHFWSIFTSLDIGLMAFFDPSIIVGAIGIILLLANKKNQHIVPYLFAPLLVLSFLFLYIAPEEHYGWYKYSLYPFIATGLGYIFLELYREKATHFIIFLPLLAMVLEHSQLLTSQANRLALVFFYGLVTLAVLLRNRFSMLKPLTISLLLILFLFEVLWTASTLEYIHLSF